MRLTMSRAVLGTVIASALIAATGFAIELFRFGASLDAASARLEQDVRRRFEDSARRTNTLARNVAAQGVLVADAATNPDHLPALFTRLDELARPIGQSQLAATVYIPVGPAGQYRVLAWSDGPAQDLPPSRLADPTTVFVAVGTAGLRVVSPAPIEVKGRRVGIATAETIVAPEVKASGRYVLTTAYGPVTLVQDFGDAGELQSPAHRVIIRAGDGRPLVVAQYSADELTRRRTTWRVRVMSVAALPFVAALLVSIGRLLERRRGTRDVIGWITWSLVAALVLALATAVLAGLFRALDATTAALYALIAVAALGVSVLLLVSLWWRPLRRFSWQHAPVRFIVEQLVAGAALALAVLVASRVLHTRISPSTLETWQFPLLPLQLTNLLYLAGLLLIQIAIGWSAAAILAVIAERWRVTWRRPARASVAVVLWTLPTIAVALWVAALPPLPLSALAVAVGVAVVFALVAPSARRGYRRTSQAVRLLVLFAALLLPPIAFYPIAAEFAGRAARTLVETNYGPATAQQVARLWTDVLRTQQEIDADPKVLALLSATGVPSSDKLAFEIWRNTSLGRARTTSEIELYGPDRKLISHFVLNVPEFDTAYRSAEREPASCEWSLIAEGVRFGADERTVFNAERGICDSAGVVKGIIVVRAVLDYGTLPFVSSSNPYYNVLDDPGGAQSATRLLDLQVVVYGWSLQPLFTSGTIAWPVTGEDYKRLYASRDPFWTELGGGERDYAVYFQNDRTSIYAVGYPLPTLRDHTTRLAEVAAVIAGLFVLWLTTSALYAPFARRRRAPIRVLVDEIRRSFHRKIFLFFVFAAVAPVLLFALAFGAYMSERLREKVEQEAASVVAVARRVFDEIAAVDQAPDRSPAAPTDDVMVWIRQVIDQDVNLYVGSKLVASSQRDLFSSGLLPTRTPASVYRAVVLNRQPVYVEEDRSGTFRYLVAAAAVGASGRDALISVPLALRQQEIEREIDELNRGVLVGAVLVVLFAANLGAAVAGKFSDRVAGLTRATRLIAAGRLDVRVPVDTADELGRLGDDFNTMSATLAAQRAELARTNQIKAWAEMARQVAHEIKNPLTPIQLAAEHLQRVHEDQRRPLGRVFDQCVTTVLRQVRLLRQIASEFANFAGDPSPRPSAVPVDELLDAVVGPYRLGLSDRTRIDVRVDRGTPAVWVDRTLTARALTNLVENAIQAMPNGGVLTVHAARTGGDVTIRLTDTGVGMDAETVSRVFEPYFSTKTGGSGLGLANAKRNIERSGGRIDVASAPGQGTTVTVALPAALVEEEGTRAAPRPDDSGTA